MMFTNSNGILKRKRVGFLLSRRKMRKSIFDTFAHLCEKTGIDLIEMYINDHPEIIVIDPMESVQKLFDRITSYQIMKECEILEEGARVSIPNFAQIDELDFKLNLKKIESAVCKTVIGHGSESCHEVFVAGNNHYIVERPSIKNFYMKDVKDQKTIFFSSHDLDEDDKDDSVTTPDEDLVLKLVQKLQPKLNLAMFGIDIIVEKGTGHHVVIDINYFPGYEGAPSFPVDFAKYVHDLLSKHHKTGVTSGNPILIS
ncbi:Inositol-tetrakisphosphate 1-kinase [Acropora cervicornis]|uniref:inositol-1,3,4-trisphosphate 5/6-kinase n=1 Tax=Acropora cervicornis TaxID=6130 RepID=A0AAD9QWN7_ACRCE|nr:Inositol-tetrakisphosphate 1-kinase [Acropora cervicornis]